MAAARGVAEGLGVGVASRPVDEGDAAGVWAGVGETAGFGVALGVGFGVGLGVALGVAFGVGVGVGFGVGVGVGEGDGGGGAVTTTTAGDTLVRDTEIVPLFLPLVASNWYAQVPAGRVMAPLNVTGDR